MAKHKPISISRKSKLGSEKRSARKAILIEIATRVLADEGPENFSMNRVAAAAGMRLSGLQYYFATKNTLIHGMLVDILYKDRAAIGAALHNDSSNPRDKLEKAIDIYARNCEDIVVNKVVLYFWMIALYDDEIMRYLDEWYIEYIQLFSDIIKAANPSIDQGTLTHISAMILALIDGTAIMINGGPIRQRALGGFLNTVKELILNLAINTERRPDGAKISASGLP